MGSEARSGIARLTPVDEEGIPCGDSIFLTEGVNVSQVENDFSASLTVGTALLTERYCVEMWIPQERCDSTTTESYMYVMDTNSPALRAMWDQDYWENIAAMKNSHGRQILWPDVEALRPYVGLWVAVVDGKVVWSRDTVKELVQHLCTVDVEVDSIFRVPRVGEHDER